MQRASSQAATPGWILLFQSKGFGSNKFSLYENQHRDCFWQASVWALFCNNVFLFLQQTAATVMNYLLVKVCPSPSQQNQFLLVWNLTKPNHSQEHSLQENVVKMERRSLISKNRIIVCPKFTSGVFRCVSIFLKTYLVLVQTLGWLIRNFSPSILHYWTSTCLLFLGLRTSTLFQSSCWSS